MAAAPSPPGSVTKAGPGRALPSSAPRPPRQREEADREPEEEEEDWAALEDALFGADGEVAGPTERKVAEGPPSSAARCRASPPAAGPRSPQGGGLPGQPATRATTTPAGLPGPPPPAAGPAGEPKEEDTAGPPPSSAAVRRRRASPPAGPRTPSGGGPPLAGPPPTRATRATRATPTLAGLPEPLLLRALSKFAAEDLCSVCRVSRQFDRLGSDGLLWLRLGLQRFGGDLGGGGRRAGSWKARYFEQAKRRLDQLRRTGGDPALLAGYQQAERALWARPPADGPPDGLAAPPLAWAARSAAHWAIHGFRRDRGLLGAAPRRCPQRCAFRPLSPEVSCCEVCGAAHLCDEQCDQQRYDPKSSCFICGVTGRMFAVVGVGPGHREAGEAGEAFGEHFEKGVLGRAMELGYECKDERELRVKCGVHMA